MPPERPGPSDDDLRLAHKVNRLVDEGKVTPEEASDAEAAELERMVTELFDPAYTQNYFRPAEMQEKDEGQQAEDVLVDILNDPKLYREPIFRVRHGTQEEDQREKIDLFLEVEGEAEPIPIQVTSQREANALYRKAAQLSKQTLLVILPPAERILDAYRRHNPRDLQSIAQHFVREVLGALARNWEWRETYAHIVARFEH